MKILLLMMFMSGCATEKTSYSAYKLQLPEMPIAGNKVYSEIDELCGKTKCKDERYKNKEECQINKCQYIDRYMLSMFKFEKEYNIYKEELVK